MILLLDNTVLSNFALVDRLKLLPKALENQIAAPRQVIAEYDEGVKRGILPETEWDWLQVVKLESAEEALFEEHLRRLNPGEAACLAIAVHRNGFVLTDDRDARKLAAQLKVPVSGTLGVLLRLVQTDTLTLHEANSILQQMIDRGYRSPVHTLDEL